MHVYLILSLRSETSSYSRKKSVALAVGEDIWPSHIEARLPWKTRKIE